MADWNRCDVCKQFIGFRDLNSGEAVIRLLTFDTEYTRETWETLCKRHAESKRRHNGEAGQG